MIPLTEKTRKILNDLRKQEKELFYYLLDFFHKDGFNVQVSHGLRTFEEQNKLYEIGRTKEGKIVTQAKGGESLHNYGLAIDIFILDKEKKADWRVSELKKIGLIFKKSNLHKEGIRWGGDWTSFRDYPHFERSWGYSYKDIKKIEELRGEKFNEQL